MRRDTEIILDLQTLFLTVLKDLQSAAPWSRWQIVRGYPNATILDNFSNLTIYVMAPTWFSPGIANQGAKKSTNNWQITIGVWADKKTGGVEETLIATSRIMDFFGDVTKWAQTEFNVTLGSTAYTDTTLIDQGINIFDVSGPQEILNNVDTNEFRNEFTINFRS